eukprot:5371095-Alexandrium_andersonii.AAC.1
MCIRDSSQPARPARAAEGLAHCLDGQPRAPPRVRGLRRAGAEVVVPRRAGGRGGARQAARGV